VTGFGLCEGCPTPRERCVHEQQCGGVERRDVAPTPEGCVRDDEPEQCAPGCECCGELLLVSELYHGRCARCAGKLCERCRT